MNYVLGLDVGISSVGWCVLNLDDQRIEALGVRAFNEAEDKKTGAPLAEPRRLSRSARRRLRRRAGRLRRAKDLFVTYGLIPPGRVDEALATSPGKPDPWSLRAKGLDHLLQPEEFARALFHIVKRRGFKSNRREDSAKADQESRKMLAAIEENRRRMQEKGYRTAGEMFVRDERFAERKRNTEGFYGFSVDRSLLEEEIKVLFESQRRLGNTLATADFERDLLDVFRWQMPFVKGDRLLSLVGECTFEPEEKRAPKSAPTTERFNLLQHINRLVITQDGTERRLEPEERAAVRDLAYRQARVTYAQLRRRLSLPDSARFKGLAYNRRKDGQMDETLDCEKATFAELKGYHSIREAMETHGLWEQLQQRPEWMDEIAFAATFFKTEEDFLRHLHRAGLPDDIANAALEVPSFSKVGHLSLKAMQRMMPYLEQGMLYSEAAAAAGYDHSSPRRSPTSHLLPPFDPDEVRNPVVLRALSQARKVINAVVRRYGSPCRVHIELAREVGKSALERRRIQKEIEANRKRKQEEREEFSRNFGREPREEDFIKFRLYREQNGQCAYCDHRGKDSLDLDRLFEPHYAEVDHILPYSRSFDDSMANRVVVCARCNQEKRGRTPHEWFGADSGRWEAFEAWVKATIKHMKKRNILLTRDFQKRQEDWFERNLKDTQWIARELADHVREHLQFSDPADRAPVLCLNGRVVAMARGLWGIAKVREEDDLHHAADAAVIAAMTPATVQRITRYHQAVETGNLTVATDFLTGEIQEFVYGRKFTFPPPWPDFRRELVARLSDDPARAIADLGLKSYEQNPPKLSPVIVSRMPVHKADGALHAETIRSLREEKDARYSVVRVPLKQLTRDHLENLLDTGGHLARALREQMDRYGGDSEKAFAEPFYWQRPDGSKRLVKAVRVKQSQPSGFKVRGGIADNESMVRVDVFRRSGRFYLVPVYARHIAAGVLPNRAIAAGRPEDEWPEMTEEYEFLFSLRPFDLVHLADEKDDILGYYRGVDRSSGRLKLTPPNSADEKNLIRKGARTLLTFEKLGVSLLGEIFPLKAEQRRGVEDCGHNQSRQAPG
ncbi:MAG: CRISPR-associated endonuclease Cas9 [Armatimonadota bacterium]|nr:MAG: CRISPR-associated endonuclease Cas9 [Armatimonadota bacterium]